MNIKNILIKTTCFLVCVLLFCGCSMLGLGNAIPTESVKDVTVTAQDNICEISDPAIISTLINIVNAGKPATVDGTLGITPASATLTARLNTDELQTFSIYELDSSAYVYVLTQDGNYIRVEKAALLKLLSGVEFDALYTDRQFPTATITADGKQGVLTPKSGTWSYKKLDSSFYKAGVTTETDSYKYSLKLPDAPVVAFSAEPYSCDVTVLYGEKNVYDGPLSGLEGYRMSGSGHYQYTITATWGGDDSPNYMGSAKYEFGVDFGPPAGFQISSTASNPGEPLIIYAQGLPEDEEITINSPFKFKAQFFPYEGGRVCIFPVSYLNKPGLYTLELSSKSAYSKYELRVEDKKFAIQDLTVDESTTSETIESDAANAEYDKAITVLKNVCDKEKYFEGKFIRPASGKLTTEFGTIRYVNGAATSSRHGGIDIAAKRGATVKASGNGRVLYAGKLKLTGNTVLIEHGFGLKTYYYHMDSLNIKTGDMVKQGDKIGTVGSTGFSTGPHLHFAMSVNGVFINPDTAIDNALIS